MKTNNLAGNPIPGPVPDYPHTVEITSPYPGQGFCNTTSEITFSGISITEELDGGVEYFYTYVWFSMMGFYVNDSSSKYTDNNGILTITDMDEVASYPIETPQSLTLEVTIFEDSGHIWELSATQSTNIWFIELESTCESGLNILLIIPPLMIIGLITIIKKREK
ncbi:MAG: hypothetical protein GPJ52_14020 [Candidatus Heimdallarchaeota archaeon]|nr:hypothetical protein [Candidatus Heimdallarchaeota archaeon]